LGNEGNSANLTILEQMRRGISLARNGDRVGAEVMFDAVLLQKPDHEEALVWKAAVVNDPDEAVRCLEKALRLNPNNQRARVGLEWAYKRQKEEKAAGFPAVEPPLTSFARPEISDPAAAPLKSVPGKAPNDPRTAAASPISSETLQKSVPKGYKESRAEVETKPEPAPYKKSRLPAEKTRLPSVKLPPEALPWTRKDRQPARKSGQTVRNPKPDMMQESPVFRAATPPVAFRVSPQVRGVAEKAPAVPVRLRWPLLLFGVAVGLALLSFWLSGLAAVFGVLAVLAAIAGVVLFNRARY
jgi:tetratricopeptide (TPR) repeat protein